MEFARTAALAVQYSWSMAGIGFQATGAWRPRAIERMNVLNHGVHAGLEPWGCQGVGPFETSNVDGGCSSFLCGLIGRTKAPLVT